MGTALAAIAQEVNCLYDCVDMRDVTNRKEAAMREFCRRRGAGEACLGPVNQPNDKTFPRYGPLLLTSYDRLMRGDFGITPAFFGQPTERDGVSVGQDSYFYAVYLNLPAAGYFWVPCWKHHHPGFQVPWDGGIGDDVMMALGGNLNILEVS